MSEHGNNAAMRDKHGLTGEGWYGFDLDGTLAKYDGWKGINHIGEPVKPMVELIKRMHDEGKVVKVVTARVAPRLNPETAKTRYPLYVGRDVGDIPMYAARWLEEMRKVGRLADWIYACDFYTKEMWEARDFVADWCLENLGFVPEIVYQKDHMMLELYDDRVKQVVPNTGILVENLAATGNAAAMHAALESLRKRFDNDVTAYQDRYLKFSGRHWHKKAAEAAKWRDVFYELREACDTALSETPLNCDVGTPEEQARRFDAFCAAHHFQSEKCCSDCPCHGAGRCEFKWGQLSYKGKDESNE